MDKVSAGKIGKYEIIKVLGRGGMGEVILAQDEVLGRRVAIKRPFKSALEEGLARFQLEARAATLRHPNIPAVYEMGEEDGLPYIVMEFVEGEALDKIINSGRHIDLIAKLSIIEQVCSALGYAHEKGIIHRDIKPANVIVQPDGVAKIIDFGIAKIQEPGGNAALTQTSQILGSLYYIAPERFKGEASDGRVDIFSAGVMLFKLLTGKEPFTGGEATASYKIVNEAHSSLGAYLQDYPPALDGILEKALAKNPDDRYLVAEDFADALHEVIEELKKGRVFQLFDDAERLAAESRYAPALELLDEAIRLDPANTQARKLRKLVREHQDRIKRADRLREFTSRADEALASENYDEALNHLKEAERLDATSTDIRARIQSVEEKKRRRDMSARALADADAARKRSDLAGAQRIVAKALADDPEHQALLAASAALAREAEIEAQRGKVVEILRQAREALDAKNVSVVEQLLRDAEAIDPSNPETDKLRREAARVREQEERRGILDEIQRRTNDFLKANAYDQATDLLNRAIDKLPNEAMLHRLKALVDGEKSKFESKRTVDSAIARARELFANSPLEAIAVLQESVELVAGEERERLISFERSLRQQFDMLRIEQVHADILSKARELMAAKQFDKAIGVLESFEVEFGAQGDISELLTFAREELARQNRGATIDRCIADARKLVREERLDDAIRLLDRGIQETGDSSLSRLLEEVREQQSVSARKIELLNKRVALLRDRSEFDEAIRLLQAYLGTTPKSAPALDLLQSIQADRDQKQIIFKAIGDARLAAGRKDFAAGLESLKAVLRAYGESPELTLEVQELEAKRAEHAQDAVSQAVESARAALLKNDPQGALAALKCATPFMQFADAKRQADWERIGQSVKKALQETGSASSTASFDAQLSEIAAAKPRKMPVWAIASAGVVMVAIGAIAVLKLQSPSTPKVSTEARLIFAVKPVDAEVSIDNGTPKQADSRGQLTVPVKPEATHHVEVSKDGFETYKDDLPVKAGDELPVPVSLSALPAAGVKTGTLTPMPQGLAQVRVFVDGLSKGTKRAGEKITLPEGSHRVKYAWPDYQDSLEHPIQIAKDSNFPDTFSLVKSAALPAKPTTTATNGKAVIQTTPSAPATGAVQPPQTNVMAPAAVLPASGTLNSNLLSVARGARVVLSWDVKNAPAGSISISGIGTVASPQGTQPVTVDKNTTYYLSANGAALAQATVEVFDPTPKPSTDFGGGGASKAPPSLPGISSLEAALVPYSNLFQQAKGKNAKDCKATFHGRYNGGLSELENNWCGHARSFEVADQCTQVGGTPDAPTLSCTDTRTITPNDGAKSVSNKPRTFHFAKNSDGTFTLLRWD